MDAKDELAIYRTFLHRLAMAAQSLKAKECVPLHFGRVVDWSYAHRCGNGELPPEEQDALIERATIALLEDGDERG